MNNVNHPKHYNTIPGCPEVIELTEQMGFLQGNIIKYIMRAPYKGHPLEDLEKAEWYAKRYVNMRTHCRDGWRIDKRKLDLALRALFAHARKMGNAAPFEGRPFLAIGALLEDIDPAKVRNLVLPAPHKDTLFKVIRFMKEYYTTKIVKE